MSVGHGRRGVLAYGEQAKPPRTTFRRRCVAWETAQWILCEPVYLLGGSEFGAPQEIEAERGVAGVGLRRSGLPPHFDHDEGRCFHQLLRVLSLAS
jgi:hypothetical protein